VLSHEFRELAEEFDVVSELLANVWALHLHDHFSSAAKQRPVRLAKTGAAERCFVEFVEQFVYASLELLLDDSGDLGKRRGRNIVLQFLQLPDVDLWEEIGT